MDDMEIVEETELINLHYTFSYLFSSDQQSYCFRILEKQSIAGTQQMFAVWVNEWMKENYSFLNFYLLIWERERFVVPWIDAFIGWFFWYVAWPGIKTATLIYQDDSLTNWATCPELGNISFSYCPPGSAFLWCSNIHACFCWHRLELSKQQLMSISFPVIKTVYPQQAK